MEGTVHAINAEIGLVAIDTRMGYSILEQTGNDFEIGDHVTWSPDLARGAGDVRNTSRGRLVRVYFQNHGVPGTFLKVNLEP
ncbi:MAG TPA: hypothetical protein VIM61_05265 [Chthoniobacterales bacterium]